MTFPLARNGGQPHAETHDLATAWQASVRPRRSRQHSEIRQLHSRDAFSETQSATGNE